MSSLCVALFCIKTGVGADSKDFLVIVAQRIEYIWHKKETHSIENKSFICHICHNDVNIVAWYC